MYFCLPLECWRISQMTTVPWLSIDIQGDIKSFWEVLHTGVKITDLLKKKKNPVDLPRGYLEELCFLCSCHISISLSICCRVRFSEKTFAL